MDHGPSTPLSKPLSQQGKKREVNTYCVPGTLRTLCPLLSATPEVGVIISTFQTRKMKFREVTLLVSNHLVHSGGAEI